MQLRGTEATGRSAASIKSAIKERALGAMCRELLKFGNSKEDKAVSKEFAKLLPTLVADDELWLTTEKVQ